jgi:hypothetical protein
MGEVLPQPIWSFAFQQIAVAIGTFAGAESSFGRAIAQPRAKARM